MNPPDQIPDAIYATTREAEERVAAAAATKSAIRDAHFIMAERYADRAWAIAESPEAMS